MDHCDDCKRHAGRPRSLLRAGMNDYSESRFRCLPLRSCPGTGLTGIVSYNLKIARLRVSNGAIEWRVRYKGVFTRPNLNQQVTFRSADLCFSPLNTSHYLGKYGLTLAASSLYPSGLKCSLSATNSSGRGFPSDPREIESAVDVFQTRGSRGCIPVSFCSMPHLSPSRPNERCSGSAQCKRSEHWAASREP